MNITKATLTAVSVLALASPIHAAQPGMFLSLSAGQADMDTGVSSGSGIDVDDTDTTWGATIGYQFNKFIGAEAGYRKLGTSSITLTSPVSFSYLGDDYTVNAGSGVKAEIDGWSLGLIGSLPVADNFDVYAKAGYYFWNVDFSAYGSGTVNGTPYSGSGSIGDDDGEDPYYGIGALYRLTDRMGVGVEWLRYSDVSDADVDVIGANFVFSF